MIRASKDEVTDLDLHISQVDIDDNSEVTAEEVGASTTTRKYSDGYVVEDSFVDEDGTVYEDGSRNPLSDSVAPVQEEYSCPYHCSPEEAARLYRSILTKSGTCHRDSLLDDIERLYYREEGEAAANHREVRPISEITSNLAKYLEMMKEHDLKFRGLDPDFVNDQIQWAKWLAAAAAAELFHEPKPRCGSLRSQVAGQ
jgi:hypothetical protein